MPRSIATLDANGVLNSEQVPGGLGGHPDLTVHDLLGLATDANLTTHEQAADPHTGYLTESAHTEAVHTAMTGLATQAELDAHAGASDPHPIYATEAEAAAQVAAHVAVGDPHTAYATDTDLSNHAAAADPHPGYLTPAEGNAAYQPVDSDLTAIAALTTTTFGRALLALADAAALAALHTHGGGAASDPNQGSYAPGSFTVPTGKYALVMKRLTLTGSQRVTLQGTARLRIT